MHCVPNPRSERDVFARCIVVYFIISEECFEVLSPGASCRSVWHVVLHACGVLCCIRAVCSVACVRRAVLHACGVQCCMRAVTNCSPQLPQQLTTAHPAQSLVSALLFH